MADHRGERVPWAELDEESFGVDPPFGQAPEADDALLPADRAAQLGREQPGDPRQAFATAARAARLGGV